MSSAPFPSWPYAFPILGDYARRAPSPRFAFRAAGPLLQPARRARPARVYAVCDELIARRRAAGGRGEDLLSLLVGARDRGERLDDAEIRDQVLIFLLAGHDTTALALTFALYLLGRHRDAQRRLRDEVDAVLGDRTPDGRGLRRGCPTRRWWSRRRCASIRRPGAWAAEPPTETASTAVNPAGSDVVVSAWVTHRHPAFWEDPERFDPERFAPEHEAERHRHAYFPFGAGPRACIGQYFSMLEAVIALAVIVQHYELASTTEHVPLAPRITLNPAAPVPCLLTARRPRG